MGESPFISLFRSVVLHSLVSQGPVCHPSPCPTHHRASLWILRASAAFSLSLPPPAVDGRRRCRCVLLARYPMVAMLRTTEGVQKVHRGNCTTQPSRTQLNFNRFASAALFPSLNSLSLTDFFFFQRNNATRTRAVHLWKKRKGKERKEKVAYIKSDDMYSKNTEYSRYNIQKLYRFTCILRNYDL